jgi:hypothetical protein
MSGKKRDGHFVVKRKTIGKRMRAKLLDIKQQLRNRTHDPVARTATWLRSVVQGYFNYHASQGISTVCGCIRSTGRGCIGWLSSGSRTRASFIRFRAFALTPAIQDRSPVR